MRTAVCAGARAGVVTNLLERAARRLHPSRWSAGRIRRGRRPRGGGIAGGTASVLGIEIQKARTAGGGVTTLMSAVQTSAFLKLGILTYLTVGVGSLLGVAEGHRSRSRDGRRIRA
jgi:hypothetical protein